MCGLAGVIGDLNQQHKDAFKDLMRVASLRGVHSSGVIAVSQQNEYKFAKEVGEPAFLFDTKRFEDTMNGLKSGLIGHCRHKTVGEISRKAAHPFDFPEKGIIGVHNGTLRDYRHLTGHNHQKVDSEVLYEHLAEHGPEETFNDLEGAWACVWWNNNTNTIHFIRNKERPLWFCWTKDNKAMFWASELWMLAAVERKMDLHPGEDEKNPQKYLSLPVDTMWTFEVTPNAAKKINFKAPQKIEIVKEVRRYSGNSHGATSCNHGAWRYNAVTKTNERVTQSGVTMGTPTPQTNLPARGGSVPNPFPRPLLTLDDPLPGEETKGSTVGGKPSTEICAVPFMQNSLISKDSLTPSKSLNDSKRNTLSPRFPNSNVLELPDKRNQSGSSRACAGSSALSSPEGKKTSVRVISGLSYITDNKTSKEYREDVFEQNTGAECGFCHQPIGSMSEVHEFLDEDNFLCTGCVVAPQIPSSPLQVKA